MLVYIDAVFILSLAQDCALVIAAGLCLKEKLSALRIVLAGIIGAVYQIFCMILSVNFVPFSIFVAYLQVLVAYKYNKGVLTLIYIAEAAFVAGIMYAGGKAYYGLLFVLSVALFPYIASKIRMAISVSKLNLDVRIKYGENEITVRGFIDSGNGVPAIILDRRRAYELLGKTELDDMLDFKMGNYTLLPCSTVKGNTCIPVFEADEVWVDGVKKNIKIGVVNENIPYALLPTEFLEKENMHAEKIDTAV